MPAFDKNSMVSDSRQGTSGNARSSSSRNSHVTGNSSSSSSSSYTNLYGAKSTATHGSDKSKVDQDELAAMNASLLKSGSSSSSSVLTQYSQGKSGDKASMTVITSSGQQAAIAGGTDIGSYITDEGNLKTQNYLNAIGEQKKLAEGYVYYKGNLMSPASIANLKAAGTYDSSNVSTAPKLTKYIDQGAKSRQMWSDVKQVYNNSAVINEAKPGTFMLTTMGGDAYYRADANSDILAGGSDFRNYLTTAGLPVSTYKVSAAVAESKGYFDNQTQTVNTTKAKKNEVNTANKAKKNEVKTGELKTSYGTPASDVSGFSRDRGLSELKIINDMDSADSQRKPSALSQKLQAFRDSGGLSTTTILSSGGNNTFTTGVSGGTALSSNADTQPSSSTALSAAQTIIADAMQPDIDSTSVGNLLARAQAEGVTGLVGGVVDARDNFYNSGALNVKTGFESGNVGQMAAGAAQFGVSAAADAVLPLDAINAVSMVVSGRAGEMTLDDWVYAGIDILAGAAGLFTMGGGYLAIKGAKTAAKSVKAIGKAGSIATAGAGAGYVVYDVNRQIEGANM